ncbi:MAG: citrate transporter [Aeromonadales bacterium]|nr:citrate transporter [Aeromonadales bacterium]
MKYIHKIMAMLVLLCVTGSACAGDQSLFTRFTFYGIRYEMIIFGLMLVGVALFYTKTMQVAICGLLAICFYKYEFTDGFSVISKLIGHYDETGKFISGSWNTYLNLALMLPGFSVLANIFEGSKLPTIIPRYIPHNYLGGFILLIVIFVLSAFLDNIAAAMIGGSLAMILFKGKVHIGFVAAICAASNAGGAGSVVGDTTTTLIWIYGKDPLVIAQAFLPAIVAILFVAYFASKQQDKYSPIDFASAKDAHIDKKNLSIVVLILAGAISFNYLYEFPALGIWIAILLGSLITKINFKVVKSSIESTVFLVALVFCAELVPIESVPDASILSTLSIGFLSAVFNNIPLTQLCLIKGGYDWPLMSYAVGFGGSMIWFGSSAGVAVCDMFGKARSFVNWLRYGWHIPVGFVIGFGVYLLVLGWDPIKGNPADQIPVQTTGYSQSVDTVQTTTTVDAAE